MLRFQKTFPAGLVVFGARHVAGSGRALLLRGVPCCVDHLSVLLRFSKAPPLKAGPPLALLTWRAPKTTRPIDLPWTGFLLRLILFGEKNCPLGRFLTPALCTASHRVFGPWGLICPGFRLPGEVFLRIKASDTFGRNLGFSPNGGLRARKSMRSGAKGGGWRWTLLLARSLR